MAGWKTGDNEMRHLDPLNRIKWWLSESMKRDNWRLGDWASTLVKHPENLTTHEEEAQDWKEIETLILVADQILKDS